MLYGEGEQEEQRKMVSCDEKLERGTKGEVDEGNHHCHLHHKILLQIITKTVTITIMNYKVMRSQETGGKWSRVMRKRQAELVSDTFIISIMMSTSIIIIIIIITYTSTKLVKANSARERKTKTKQQMM